jgi:hypothetical protein
MPYHAAMENRSGENEVVPQTPRQSRRPQVVATTRRIALSSPVHGKEKVALTVHERRPLLQKMGGGEGKEGKKKEESKEAF